jgi:hypothetical protein
MSLPVLAFTYNWGTEGSTRTESEPAAVVACESVTVAWNANVPVWSVVPARTPVLDASENPSGREPEEIAQEYGGTPPVAASEILYGLSAVADAKV